MATRRLIRLIVGTAIAVLTIPAAFGQFSEKIAWAQRNWKDDDHAYIEVRKRYEALPPEECAKELRSMLKELENGATGREILFRWMTLCIDAIRGNPNLVVELDNSPVQRQTLVKLATNMQPTSYEYTRAMFVHLVTFDFPALAYVPIGKRLLAKDPDDLPVALCQLKLMQPQAFPADRPAGLSLVAKIDRLDKTPNAGIDFRIGVFYYLCWQKEHGAEDRAKAEARFSKVITATTSRLQREHATKLMNEMKRGG